MLAQSARSIIWLGVLLDASVKGVVVLAMAGALTLALRRSSAALRHLIWSLAVVSLVILPVLSAVLPSWQVPILPRPVSTSQSSFDIGRSGVSPDTEHETAAGETPALPIVMRYPAPGLTASMNDSMLASVPSYESLGVNRLRLTFPVWILLLWVAGTAAAVAPLFVGIVGVWRRARRARPVTDGTWARLLPTLSEELGLGRRVSLLKSDRAAIPTTWGFFRPIVLLPSEAQDWPAERCRIVLLHELAHVRRCDWLTQMLARFACALHWFNPLVWLAARRMRVESEQACDDSVLRAGHKASGYADELLEIVRTMRPAGYESLATVPIARQSRIQKRLTAILDAGRSRRALTHLSITLALIAVSCAVLPLAAIRPTAKAQEPAEQTQTQSDRVEPVREWKVTLPVGVIVELIGVSYHPSEGELWWRPDGSLLDEAPYDRLSTAIAASENGQTREFAVRLENIPADGCGFRYKIAPSHGTGSATPYKGHQPARELRAVVASIPGDLATASVRVGIAAGPWEETVATSRGNSATAIGLRSGGVTFSVAHEVGNQTRITVSDTLLEFDHRVVAVDVNQKTHSSPDTDWVSAGAMRQTTASFDNLAPSDIEEFRFQTRPYEWVEFENVSLSPSKRTDVEVITTAAVTADDPVPPERRLHFPDDWSIGTLRARDFGAADPEREWWSEHYPSWEFHAAAEGTVTVPAGKEVALLIRCSGSEDFSPLAKLRPGDVDGVSIECSGESSNYMEPLSSLTWLETLQLQQKNIQNEDLRWLKRMNSLKRLSVFAAHLNDGGIAHVGQLTLLKSLRISGEDFTDAGLAHLSNLVSLEEMFLGRRDILGDGLAHLAKLPRLERLDFYAVTVSGAGATHLSASTSLKELDFTKSDLTPEDLGHIAAIPNLETLRIHRMITDDAVAHLSSARSLKKLILGMDFQDSRDLITDVALASLSKVSSLESIGLYYGKFTDEGLEHLSGLPNLKSLAIPNCRGFTDAGLEHLSKLSHLEHLDLRRVSFSDAGLKGLKEALPNCDIKSDVARAHAAVEPHQTASALWTGSKIISPRRAATVTMSPS